MHITDSEIVWQGRLHLGDEPGIYGDATYTGLAVELPLTLIETASTNTASLVVRAENVHVIAPYQGHIVSVVSYQQGDATEIGNARIAASGTPSEVEIDVALDLSSVASPGFIGVRIHVDSAVAPGLYNDFVISGLRLSSPDHAVVAKLGFHS